MECERSKPMVICVIRQNGMYHSGNKVVDIKEHHQRVDEVVVTYSTSDQHLCEVFYTKWNEQIIVSLLSS